MYEALQPKITTAKENSKSNNNVPGKSVEVLGGPGELLCMDFGDYGRSNLLIIKDCYSGMLRVYLTKDKTAESATKGVEKWSHTYDQGLCFAGKFTEWNRSVGINHCVSSAYNPQSNGAAERGVASIKALLTKMGKKGQLSQDELDKIVFKLNAHQTAKEGSALERFYMRPVKTVRSCLTQIWVC